MKIYLSPSSQFGNLYSFGGYNEAKVCGMIAEAAYSALKRNGFDVKLGSIYTSMEYRTQESNEWGADYHLPIHTNAGGGEGTVVFCYSGSRNNKYVEAVYKALAEISPGQDRGIKVNNGLYEINVANGVTIYTETEFHDDTDLAKWIVENVDVIGEAIAKGFCDADNKDYIGPNGDNISSEISDNDFKPVEKENLSDVDIVYQAYTDRWWPPIKNNQDWAGESDGIPIRFLAVCVSKGTIRGRVHTVKDGWLPYLTFADKYNLNDIENGILGNGNPMDAVELYYYTPDGYSYKRVAYRVSGLNNEAYYAIQHDNETSNRQDGYAGLFGIPVDKFQAWIV